MIGGPTAVPSEIYFTSKFPYLRIYFMSEIHQKKIVSFSPTEIVSEVKLLSYPTNKGKKNHAWWSRYDMSFAKIFTLFIIHYWAWWILSFLFGGNTYIIRILGIWCLTEIITWVLFHFFLCNSKEIILSDPLCIFMLSFSLRN